MTHLFAFAVFGAVSTWAISARSTYCASVRPSAAARASRLAFRLGKVLTEIGAVRVSSAMTAIRAHCLLTCGVHGRNLHTLSANVNGTKS